jgi:DNA gyrase subunit A
MIDHVNIKNRGVDSMEERIIRVDYEDEMKQSFIDYAMNVIVDRALPDVRDGLKPVHRRILYAMHDLGMTHDKPFKKSARIVGEVIGKYHPHGDSAVYETMVRLAQDFNLNIPLVQGHGNFGSIDGDRAAAMRYTEARLSPIALEVLGDIDKDVITYDDNFDNTLKEPSVLPSRFPQLLVNGVEGIAVGMATSIPQHNSTEVFKGIIKRIDNPNITIKQLMKTIKGPDFPTGGIITNKEDLFLMYETGKGKIRIRAKLEVESASHGRTNVVITEIPQTHSGSKTKLIEKLIDLAKDRKLDEITDVRDESDRTGIRIVLEVKRGINIENFLNKLYMKTPLEDTMGVEFLAIVNDRPQTLNLLQIIDHYIDFQKEITTKKYQYLLRRAEDRKEVLEGLLRATDVIDVIIEAIRGSKDVNMVKKCLMTGAVQGIAFKTKSAEKQAKKFDFSERQTQAILDMRLQRLIQLEISKLNEELESLLSNIHVYEDILGNESSLLKVIKTYLEEMQKNFGKKRKTVIDDIETQEYVEEIKEEELYILVDRFGYIKATELANVKRASEDALTDFSHSFVIMNTDKIAVFTNKGNFHQIKAMDVPKIKMKDKGIPIENITKMDKEEIIWIGSVSDVLASKLLLTTKQGFVKVIEGNEFDTIRGMINATKLEDDDLISSVVVIKDEPEHVALITKSGKALKFPYNEVPLQKRNSKGVSGIIVKDKDEVCEVQVIAKGEQKNIVWKKKEVALNSIRARKRNSEGKPL